MKVPKELKYTKDHEWIQDVEGGRVRIGLTDYAQSELGDIVFVTLPAVGDALKAGGSFTDVESVKAVSDVYSPVDGVVTAINDTLEDTPEAINGDCYAAWLIEAGDVAGWGEVMDAEEYEKLIAQEG